MLQDPALELAEMDEKRGTRLVVAEVFTCITCVLLTKNAAGLIVLEVWLVLVADISPFYIRGKETTVLFGFRGS